MAHWYDGVGRAVLFAVHLSDVLVWEWWLGGYLAAGLLLAWAAHGIRDDEIPRVALLTAAFFVSSSIHLKVGPGSVHLLLNGLIGVVAGRRAPLAVAVGLFWQALLLGHGGMTTLGANTCIIALPALLAGGIYRWGSRTGRVGRACLLGLGLGLAALALAVSGSYLTGHDVPWLLAIPAAVVLGLMAAGIGWARGLSSIWPAGLVAGMGGVLGAAALNALVLTFGTDAPFARLAGLLFASHLPLAIVEGIVVASAIGFLRSVRPDLIDDPQVIDAAQPAG